MKRYEKIHRFAEKYRRLFETEDTKEQDVVRDFGKACDELGFDMDCGQAFEREFGPAAHDAGALEKIWRRIKDVDLLGSAIYSKWRYYTHWAQTSILCDKDWFRIALGILEGLTVLPIFEGTLKKIKILSYGNCYGFRPEPNDEVEQHLILYRDGRVYLSRYAYGSWEEFDGKHRKISANRFRIEKDCAEKLFYYIESYFGKPNDEVMVTDVGSWEAELTNESGEVYGFRGALCDDLMVGDVGLSEIIRKYLDNEELYVFDGGPEDCVMSLTLKYKARRYSPIIKAGREPEIVEWNETLTADRENGTIALHQSVGGIYTQDRTITNMEDVKCFLDNIDTFDFEQEPDGDPDNVISDQLLDADYEIKIEMRYASDIELSGTYDKNNLPDTWDEVISNAYGIFSLGSDGLIFREDEYGRIRRCDDDIIYLSVAFSRHGKTYYYQTDDDSIQVGDKLVVPMGYDNSEKIVYVVKKEYFKREDVPMPMEKVKTVYRKYGATGGSTDMVDRNKIYSVIKAGEDKSHEFVLYADPVYHGFKGICFLSPPKHPHMIEGKLGVKTDYGFTFVSEGYASGEWRFIEVTYDNFAELCGVLLNDGGKGILSQVSNTKELEDWYHREFPM